MGFREHVKKKLAWPKNRFEMTGNALFLASAACFARHDEQIATMVHVTHPRSRVRTNPAGCTSKVLNSKWDWRIRGCVFHKSCLRLCVTKSR